MNTPFLKASRSILATAIIVLLPSLAPAAASSSELLEKGIYTEETKGDVDAAIAIYQQLLTEAKANQSLAAQAQYRLALCLAKKNRTTEANAAFEKLIAEYPGEKEFVAKARERLPAAVVLGPVSWVDGERLAYGLTVASGMEIGTMETRADLVEANGRKVWRVGRLMVGGGQSISHADVDPETFQPIGSYWKHSLLGEATAVYRPGEIEIRKTGETEPSRIVIDKAVFDNEEFFHLMRRLPLQVGYKTSLVAVATLGGGAIPLGLEVATKETVETPAGKFDCFKVQLSIGQTTWFSDDEHRYLVKFTAGSVTGLLTSVTQRKAGSPVAFRDDELGISFNAPADWLVHRFIKGQPAKQSLIRIFDANADADDGGLRLFATDSLPTVARQSPKAWAESNLAARKDIAVRADSWKNLQISGRLAVSCIADYQDDGKPKVQYIVHALGPKNSEFFIISSAPEKFDALKAAFETVLTSYRATK
jgi:tetratricopeptide (TPR) repeat protein